MKDSVVLGYLDETIFFCLIFTYIFWRMTKSDSFSIMKMIKGNMRSTGIFFLLFSCVCFLLYNFLVVFLSNFYEIDKNYIEKIGHLEGIHFAWFFNRKIDLVTIYNISFSLANVFKVSAIFLLIGLWLPCAYSFAISNKEVSNHLQTETELNVLFFSGKESLQSQKNLAEALSHATIITFSTLYAFFRIPLSILFNLNFEYLPEKKLIFYRSVFYGSELFLCVLFFLILKSRFLGILHKNPIHDRAEKKSVENVNFLILILMMDALMRYYINIIAMPVELNGLSLHVLRKVSFVVQISIYLLLVSMFCPTSEQIFEKRGESLAAEKPFWRPRDLPRLEYDCAKENGVTVSEINNPNEEISNTAIIEFNNYREGMINEK
ncbi:hypothetical protein GVAV_001606 [Gurleya vavrai]